MGVHSAANPKIRGDGEIKRRNLAEALFQITTPLLEDGKIRRRYRLKVGPAALAELPTALNTVPLEPCEMQPRLRRPRKSTSR